MAGTIKTGGKRGGIADINITPMVDILLVLLVILMATANYIVRRNMQVNLPAAATSDAPVAPVATITIEADGALSYDGEAITETALQTRLQEIRSESEDATVIINGDRAAQHGMVVGVMDMARQARLTHFSIQVVRGED
jgi:biopolymer transport protein ExbD